MRRFAAYAIMFLLFLRKGQAGQPQQQQHQQHQHRASELRNELLSKAFLVEDRRSLAGGQNDQQADDFYDGNANSYNFAGYSLKYTKCQPVQYFSADAIAAGEHSPMITEDIVLLRLCSTCSSSSMGCQTNYADYAMDVAQYVRILLKYSALKQEAACDYCQTCGYANTNTNSNGNRKHRHRKLEEDAADENNQAAQDNANEEQQQQQQQQQQQEEGDAANNNGQDQAGDTTTEDCSMMDSICPKFTCDEAEGNTYLDYEGYMNYLDCVQVNYNGYAYFVQPHCDGESGTIKMAVFYDNYCASYAGSEVSVKNLGVGFREGFFQDYYSGECIDCSESTLPPFYNLNSQLCNKIHDDAAKCTTDLQFDLSGEEIDTTECSYIESLRHGTYDSKGKLSYSSGVIDWDSEVSLTQLLLLISTSLFVVGFLVYACYLHHSMTNLLIKSLSHRELLPPSRHVKRPIV